MRLVWLIREVRIRKNFVRERLRVVSDYERAKLTRKARGANNLRRYPRFACLLIFAGRMDSACYYFHHKLKITRTLATTAQEGLAPFARCQPPPLPKETKKEVRP